MLSGFGIILGKAYAILNRLNLFSRASFPRAL